MRKELWTMILLAVLFLAPGSTTALAAPNQDGRPAPLPEAIAACSGKSVGDRVNFQTPRGRTIACVCRERNGLLFAVPENRGRMNRHRSPRPRQ
jgi:hypothetical protein